MYVDAESVKYFLTLVSPKVYRKSDRETCPPQERGALRRRMLPEVPSKSLPRPPKKPLREQSDSRSRERRGGGGALEVVIEGGQKRSHSHGDDLEVRSLRKRIYSNKS